MKIYKITEASERRPYPSSEAQEIAGLKDAKDGQEYTGAKIKGFPEAATGDRFEGDEYRFLIVARKFQTGFDQPKLVAMYVDNVPLSRTVGDINKLNEGETPAAVKQN